MDALREELNAKSDKHLAEILGISSSTLGSWVARDSIDFKYLFTVLVDMDLNWLVRGTTLAATRNPVMSANDNSDCEKRLIALEAKIEVYREIVHELSQGKGPASITLTPSKEPVKSS